LWVAAAILPGVNIVDLGLIYDLAWDDENDAHYIAKYKRLKHAVAVLALCFTESDETYHHWKVFSHGKDGVCIEFDKPRLLRIWKGDPTSPPPLRDLGVQRAAVSVAAISGRFRAACCDCVQCAS
jgi:hypothetical protein